MSSYDANYFFIYKIDIEHKSSLIRLMLNLTIKIRSHLQKFSRLDFSPKIAIFALSFKEIRRRRWQNGQADAKPCKMTVGDAGIKHRKPLQTVDIH